MSNELRRAKYTFMDGCQEKGVRYFKTFPKREEILNILYNSHLSEQETAKWQFLHSHRMRRHTVQEASDQKLMDF